MTQTTLDLTYKFSSLPEWNDYALLDSGDGERLERFGKYMLVRPEAEAIWEKSQPQSLWETTAARFVPSNEPNGGHWEKTSKMPDQWEISFRNLRFKLQLGGSKQIGIFLSRLASGSCCTNWFKQRRNRSKCLISLATQAPRR